MDCTHEEIEFDPGNHVPGYGWEIYPGHYCLDCGEQVEEPVYEPDPDLENDLAKEAQGD